MTRGGRSGKTGCRRARWLAVVVRHECAPYGPKRIGIAAVLVQAKDEAARAWYLGQAEWLEFPAGTRTLWLPVGVVGGA